MTITTAVNRIAVTTTNKMRTSISVDSAADTTNISCKVLQLLDLHMRDLVLLRVDPARFGSGVDDLMDLLAVPLELAVGEGYYYVLDHI